MSSSSSELKRSAFDVLMSVNQRKKQPKNSKPCSSNQTLASPNPITTSSSSPVANKKKSVDDEDKVAQLKIKIHLLKRKTWEFDPKSVAWWNNGEPVPFLFLSLALDMISTESGRTVKHNMLCNALRTVMHTTPHDLLPTVYLCANKLSPAHEGLELGIGDGPIITAISDAFGLSEKDVKDQSKEEGDLGLVAKAGRSSQSMLCKPEPLTIVKVFNTFRMIAREAGMGSRKKKTNHIRALLAAATDCEPQYLVKLLQANLRIGSGEQTLLAALGQAAVYTDKHSKPPSNIPSPLQEAAKIVKQVHSVVPVYDKIIPALLSNGVWNLAKVCNIALGVPVGSMLAKTTKQVSTILNKFQGVVFTCEYKYDGERAQIHYMEDGTVEIFSRNGERSTTKFPDVVIAVSRVKKPHVRSFILDCEIVAYDQARDRILPCQILQTRARKDVDVRDIKVDVCIYAFDMLYLDGEPLIQEQLEVRRERLYDSFNKERGAFQFSKEVTSNDVEEIQNFFDASIKSGCEGLIIKTLSEDATYEPSKRSNNWLKLKKDYMDNIGDSLDLVPIAAFLGRGRRAGVYGAFLLACYDIDTGNYQSICKVGTGFSDAELEALYSCHQRKAILKPKPYYRCADTQEPPDVWFEPTEVWEVNAADLTISPDYQAAIGVLDRNKGISLRFPRLSRFRHDKSPEQATSSQQVAEMYGAQPQKHNIQEELGDGNDDDE